ncbi:MAG: DUF1639 domain-containing protein [Sweet potato little leaf phytoplasma]|nr:DUF1639 domain-containing protein [Sweet potato little leaf phytoplasma]
MQSIFPGLWLSEITADSYKVPEAPETGKVYVTPALNLFDRHLFGDESLKSRKFWLQGREGMVR